MTEFFKVNNQEAKCVKATITKCDFFLQLRLFLALNGMHDFR